VLWLLCPPIGFLAMLYQSEILLALVVIAVTFLCARSVTPGPLNPATMNGSSWCIMAGSCSGCLTLLVLLSIFFAGILGVPWLGIFPVCDVSTPPPGPVGECIFFGDPHYKTFDGQHMSIYSEGDFWIVKSDYVWIQGKYLNTKWTHGLSATNSVGIGGPVLNHNKLVVGPYDNGQITWNGVPICTGFPSSYTLPGGLGTVDYNGEGTLIDGGMSGKPKHVVHITLHKWNVQLKVMRWSLHINAQIIMERVPGQDGHCSNFNGNPADDTRAAIKGRVPNQITVAPADLLFPYPTPFKLVVKRPTLADCPEPTRSKAHALCASKPADVIDQCTFDVCFGGDQYADE
jgi:hypothetical protein